MELKLNTGSTEVDELVDSHWDAYANHVVQHDWEGLFDGLLTDLIAAFEKNDRAAIADELAQMAVAMNYAEQGWGDRRDG